MKHLEVHVLESARDLGLLETAGLPRFDKEPVACTACNRSVGTVYNHQDEPVAWRRFGILMDGNRVAVACASCLYGLDTALAAS